jgi:hypothetical protein
MASPLRGSSETILSTCRDTWKAINSPEYFDVCYWTGRIFMSIFSAIANILGSLLVCVAVVLISLVCYSGFFVIIPLVAPNPYSLWFFSNVVLGMQHGFDFTFQKLQ